MADEHQFSADVAESSAPAERKSGWRTCFTGCLIVLVIVVVIGILVGFWIARHWRDWAATGLTEGIRQAVSSSQLPAKEQQEVMVQVERVAKAFREEKMSAEQLGVLAQKFVDSPLMSLLVASTLERQYIAKSGLNDAEKAEARVTLQRFIRGSIDDKIDKAGIDAAMAHVADRDARGEWKLRQTLTDDELRAFLTEAKKQADAANIPEQPAEIDPSEEIKKMVDEALAAPA